jgi:hypothetical protein
VGKKPVSNVDTDELERQERLEKVRDEGRKGRTRWVSRHTEPFSSSF